MQRNTKDLILNCFLLFTLLLVAYSNTLYSTPALDDFHSFIEEEKTAVQTLSFHAIISLAQTQFGWQRWVPMVSFAVDRWIGGGEILYFHITNISVHVLSTIFLLFFGLQVVTRAYSSSAERAIPFPRVLAAVWIAGLWALNPVQTNGVTYLVQRMASMQAMFYIAALAFYFKARSTHVSSDWKTALPYYGTATIACMGAFLSKENSAMLPIMLVATEIWFFTPEMPVSLWKRLRSSRWPRKLLFSAIAAILTYWAYSIVQHNAGSYTARHFTMGQRLLTESRIVVWYISLLLWPAPSRLSMEHDITVSTSLLTPPSTLLCLSILGVFFFLIVRFRKRYPLPTYGLLFFFANLLIESSIVPLELVFEHRVYLPAMGLSLTAVATIIEASRLVQHKFTPKDFKSLAWSFFTICLCLFAVLTYIRNEAWRDLLTLTGDSAQKAPNHPRAHANFAAALGRAGLLDQAIVEAEAAVRLGKLHFEAYAVAANTIIVSLVHQGKSDEAIVRGEELLQHLPKDLDGISLPDAYVALAQAYLDQDNPQKAYSTALLALDTIGRLDQRVSPDLVELIFYKIFDSCKEKGIDLDNDGETDPGVSQPETLVAKVFMQANDYRVARKWLKRAIEANPHDAEAGAILSRIQREDELASKQSAKWSFEEKYLRHPFSVFNSCMAIAFLIQKNRTLAILAPLGQKAVNYALSLNPDSPDALLLKSWYSHKNGNQADAVAQAQKATTMDPEFAKAWLSLGYFLEQSGRSQEANSAFERAASLSPQYLKNPEFRALVSQVRGDSTK